MAGGACVVGGVHGEEGHAWHAFPPSRLLRDMVGQCAGGKHRTGMHSCFKISLKYIRSRFDALLTRLASVTADSRWSPLLFPVAHLPTHEMDLTKELLY